MSAVPELGTQVIETLDATLQFSFKNLSTNKIVSKIMLNGKKIPTSPVPTSLSLLFILS